MAGIAGAVAADPFAEGDAAAAGDPGTSAHTSSPEGLNRSQRPAPAAVRRPFGRSASGAGTRVSGTTSSTDAGAIGFALFVLAAKRPEAGRWDLVTARAVAVFGGAAALRVFDTGGLLAEGSGGNWRGAGAAGTWRARLASSPCSGDSASVDSAAPDGACACACACACAGGRAGIASLRGSGCTSGDTTGGTSCCASGAMFACTCGCDAGAACVDDAVPWACSAGGGSCFPNGLSFGLYASVAIKGKASSATMMARRAGRAAGVAGAGATDATGAIGAAEGGDCGRSDS